MNLSRFSRDSEVVSEVRIGGRREVGPMSVTEKGKSFKQVVSLVVSK